ncbi:hypothetical protein [Ferruginibacter sp.]|nr:hypothetical protein [Ferruginibacter sp.]
MKNIKTIITLLIGAVIGFYFCHLFHRDCSDDNFPVAISDTKATELEKKIQQNETVYQQKEDSINQTNTNLDQKLQETQTALIKTKRKNSQLQTQVYSLIDKQSVYKEENDTSGYYSMCDSLAKINSQLIVFSNEQDSLRQISIETLGSQLQNRDSAIVLRHNQYQQLKSTVNQSLLQQQTLEKEAKFYKKKYKRQRFWGKLKSAGILIISGLVAKQLIN